MKKNIKKLGCDERTRAAIEANKYGLFDFTWKAAKAHLNKFAKAAYITELQPTNENAKAFASEAFHKILSGARLWTEAQGSIFDFTAGVARSLISNCVSSSENQRRSKEDSANDDSHILQNFGHISSLGGLSTATGHSEDEQLYIQEFTVNTLMMARCICRALPVEGYDKEKALVDAILINQASARSTQAEILGVDENGLMIIKKRLARYMRGQAFSVRLAVIVKDSYHEFAGDDPTGPISEHEPRSLRD